MDILIKVLKFLNEHWATLLGAFTAMAGICSAIITAIKNKNWTKLKDAVTDFVKEAEKLEAKGVVKKEVVLSKVRTLCVKLRIKFNEEKISELIESIVTLTKTVNSRDKDKVAETPK